MEEPVYGKVDNKFSDFLAPGMICSITFSHSIGMTAIAFVRERIEATLDRTYAAGVTAPIIIIAHFLTHSIVMVVQTIFLLIIAVFGFKVPEAGNLVIVFVQLLLLGSVGMSFGLLISARAKAETEAVQMALSSFFPMILLSGIIWPVQAIPSYISWLSYSLPTTWAATAMRSVMIRGWSLDRQDVWASYLISLAWVLVLLSLAARHLGSRETRSMFERCRIAKRKKKQAQAHKL
jgi:ABC-type multidrug transport system permease subunit